jgi:enediyne biosynthesis protein E4
MILWGCFQSHVYCQSWEIGSGFRSRPVDSIQGKGIGFRLVNPQSSGLDFHNPLAGDRGLHNQILLNGSGVAAADVNGDGLCDLFFSSLDAPNALYINQGGWEFLKVPGAGGASCEGQSSTGAVFADVNGDTFPDLLITGHRSGCRLFLNDRHGSFNEVTEAWGLKGTSGAASLTLADVDRNGWLDLYLVNYRNDTMRDMPDSQFDVRMVNGEYRLISFNGKPADGPDLKGRFTFDRSRAVLENGEPDQLYLNFGQGKFEVVEWEKGHFLNAQGKPVKTPYDWGLSAMFQDVNGDGAPDLYVCNDFQSPDRLWINKGDGRFQVAADEMIRQTSLFSMGLDFADINRDGRVDFFVADMLSRSHERRMVQVMDGTAFAQYRDSRSTQPQSPRNTLFIQRTDRTFSELARFAGVEASEWSWCPAFIDIDLDGFEDLLITTGHWRDAQNADVARSLETSIQKGNFSHAKQLELRKQFPVLNTPNVAFRNKGNAMFEDVSSNWGFDSIRVSHGMALADLDNDGDLDAVINCLNAPALLYQNQASGPRLRVALKGRSPNTAGIGALVEVIAPNLPKQTQSIKAGGRYLSSDQPTRTFAVKAISDLVSIKVDWPSGEISQLSRVSANQLYVIEEPKQANQQLPVNEIEPIANNALFEDVSTRLNHVHIDVAYDDFERQTLQPRGLNALGPGLTWFDFNQDGWEDLFIGSGKGGRLGVFRNDQGKKFVRQRAKAFETPLPRDLGSVLAWRNSKELALLIGQVTYEDIGSHASAFDLFSMNTGKIQSIEGDTISSPGPMAMSDWDGDGDLDLFVGGRVLPGKYPAPANGMLFRNDHGNLDFDREASLPFQGMGLISSVIFTDVVGDDLPDLVVACEWGPLQLLENRGGKFESWEGNIRWTGPEASSSPLDSFKQMRGWWNSVASIDADGDGLLDLVAGNWGRNHKYSQSSSRPVQIHYGGPIGPGGFTLLESYANWRSGMQVPSRDWGYLSSVLPWIAEGFSSFESFGRAPMNAVLETVPAKLNVVEVSIFDSVLLLNRGEVFEVISLPLEAQHSPVFGLGVGDFDGDGNEDLVVSQNFFEVSPLDSRQDAGQGLFLSGNGNGIFNALGSLQSGISIQGEGRGLAVADFDHDRRPDFVAAQNSTATKLYRNVSGQPGFSVRLKGNKTNPQAIGARIRLIYKDGSKGPARELHLGEGYWSQSPNRQILGMASRPSALEVRWPNGHLEQFEVTGTQTELTVSESDQRP